MKKVMLLMVVAVFSITIKAQANSSKNIPKKISEAFSSKYPSAQVGKWKFDKENYVAEFNLDKKKYCAFYASDGNWIKTETKIRWTWNLPKVVETAFYKSDFASYSIHGIKEVQTPTEHFYEIHVNDGIRLDSDHQQFAQDFIICFNPDGTLIKKVTLPN